MRISEERPQQCESDVKIVFVRGTMAYEPVEPLLDACVFVSGDEKLLRGRKELAEQDRSDPSRFPSHGKPRITPSFSVNG